MKPILILPAMAVLPLGAYAAAVYTDDFNRAAIGANYTTAVTAGDGGAAITGSAFLELTNDSSAAANLDGRVSTAVAFTNFSSPFSGMLSANAGLVTWETNLRYNRATNPAGFTAGNYGFAFVLAGTQADFTGGSGYAIAYGNSGSPDPLRLVRYSGGLSADANLTNIISSGAADLAASNNYASVRVTYDPTGNLWSLYVRDDGASAWASPATLGAGNRIGAATVDTTFTGTVMTHAGYLWNQSTAANQTVQLDNLSVSVVPEPSDYAGTALAAGVSIRFLRRRRSTAGRPRE